MDKPGNIQLLTPPRVGAPALRELALVFLKLGATAFGGPAAHVAMMEDEVVRRRGWLTHAEFLDLLGATNLIPGPNSTEMAIHIGWHRARWAGLLVAGACFILPAVVIVTALAWAYVRFGSVPAAEGLLYGVKPVIIAVVVQALWRLGRGALKTRTLAAVAAGAALLNLLGVDELVVLFGTGIGMAVARSARRRAGATPLLGLAPVALAPTAGGAAAVAPFGLWPLFLFFLKVGSVLFGSGYVLLAFLRADLVERWGWLTEQQLLDAVAIGQFTPGPLFTTATFIGYVLAGLPGAALATVGIFLPAFAFVALSGPLIPRLRRSAIAGAFLDGVNAAALALMAVVTWQLGRAAVVDLATALLAIASAVILIRYGTNSAWLILGGAAVGLFMTALPE
ncbi:chromate efflux transporter [Tautonia sociabilis]|uniref:Chromate efflux transporter n=1 Tax=Tautonia sociabilis TaxID=2080755 RepID=A0A432MDG4_9BACT|nr:chromate efflux transporter [Tautonia sociabilis]RUL82539.1 chromate efflux transporter [Tautonia sociabilis]